MNKKILFTIAAASLIAFGACKKDEDKKDDTNSGTTTAPTLDKSNLYDKLWQTQSGATSHKFLANGNYIDATGGTWKWLNNSDSMELIRSGGSKQIWYFKYCQGDSMECTLGANGVIRKMRDHDW